MEWLDDLKFIVILCMMIVSPILIGMMIIVNLSTRSVPIKISSVQATLENARANNNHIEIAAATQKIADYNQELATLQYWNTWPIVELFVNDCVDSVKPIK